MTKPRPMVIAAGDGRHTHFLNHLATIKVAGADTGSMSITEFVAPKGFSPPLHSHRYDDETIVVLEGELEVHRGDDRIPAGPGAVAVLPHGVPHTFVVTTDEARFVAVATSRTGAPTFDEFVTELGTPTDSPTMPEPAPIDPAYVADVCRSHDIDVVGPPPSVPERERR